jgi:hypothetical protein
MDVEWSAPVGDEWRKEEVAVGCSCLMERAAHGLAARSHRERRVEPWGVREEPPMARGCGRAREETEHWREGRSRRRGTVVLGLVEADSQRGGRRGGGVWGYKPLYPYG